MKWITIIFVGVMMMTLVSSASEFGYDNLNKPTLSKTVINYTQVNTNNSIYWDSHSWSEVSSWLYNMTQPFTDWLSTFHYNYNQTTTYFSDEVYINKNSSNGFNLNEEKLNSTIEDKLQTTFYNVTSVDLIAGENSSYFEWVNLYNGNSFNVSETAGSPGLDIRFNVTGVDEFNEIIFRYKSSIGESHTSQLQLWDYEDSAWENYGTAGEVSAYTIFGFTAYDWEDHVEDGLVQIRVLSASNGNTQHTHYFDWVTISKGVGTTIGTEVDPFSYHKDENINATGYNITADYFFGDGSQLTGISSVDTNLSDGGTMHGNLYVDGNITTKDFTATGMSYVRASNYTYTAPKQVTNGIWVYVNFEENEDVLNEYNPVNGYFIPKSDGVYVFDFDLRWEDTEAALYYINYYVDDVLDLGISTYVDALYRFQMSDTYYKKLNAGQNVSIAVKNSGTVAQGITGALTITKLH